MAKQKINSDQLNSTGSAWSTTTCTVTCSGGTAPTYSMNQIRYTLIGKTCIATWLLSNGSGGTAGASANLLNLSLPFVSKSSTRIGFGSVYNGGTAIDGTSALVNVTMVAFAGSNTAYLPLYSGNNITGVNQNNPNRYIFITAVYEVE